MKISLCLAGGGIKGAAHVGVLKALEEKQIEITHIGGTSSGSIVSALHAAGLTADEIYKVVFKSEKNEECCNNFIEVAGRSIDLLCRELSQYEMNGADRVLTIRSEKVGLLDIDKMDYLYELGYQQAREFLNEV